MLLEHYAAQRPISDEMLTTSPFFPEAHLHWKPLISVLENIGADEIARRSDEIQRLLRENGVTYSIYDDPKGLHRAWKLDPVPFIVGEHDWKKIERGLQQRVELLNLILSDLYGERRLLEKGLLPHELIFTHQGFLRSCVGLNNAIMTQQARKRQLRIYAADMARGPDNQMWVLGDRTQAPSGAGYALENRSIMSRALPDAFAECASEKAAIRRLTPFFEALQENLHIITPVNSRNPHIVVLTPGPGNETHFEHAYLASSLGYTLVQGEDLTVRDGYVWLRALGGLQRVDVILRRMDDTFCDPLELRADSQLGLPGLLEVVRRGNVAIANPLGSGILENPALMAFLPNLARHFLGEELQLPSAATWWCGQEKERRFVLENLSSLVIKPIDSREGREAFFGHELSRVELSALKNSIAAEPHRYVAQEYVSFSTAPSFIGKNLEARYTVLRSFLTATDDGYAVMPGGLTRTAADKNTFLISNQAGGVSKDTWVIAPEPDFAPYRVRSDADESSLHGDLLPQSHQTTISSRTAENLFWVGRYAERVQTASRLLRTILHLRAEHFAQGISSIASAAEAAQMRSLLQTLTHITATYPGFFDNANSSILDRPEDELLSLALDSERLGGISSTLAAFKQCVYAVRERFSADTWRVIGQWERDWAELSTEDFFRESAESKLRRLQTALDGLVTSLAAFLGLNMESMGYEEGWFLLDAGRRLERVLQMASMLRSMLTFRQESIVERLQMERALDLNECLMTYRSRFRANLYVPAVLDLLLLDPTNPRSLVYQLDRLQHRLEDLPRKDSPHTSSHERSQLSEQERLVMEGLILLRTADSADLAQANQEGFRASLDELLKALSEKIGSVSVTITQELFHHAEMNRQ